MNRKNQGQSNRNQGMQTRQPQRGARPGQQFGANWQNADQDFEMQSGPRSRNFSGDSSAEDFALDNTNPYSTYRDTDYDLDESTYGHQERSPRRMGASEYGSTHREYETNERNRQAPRYSPLADERFSLADRAGSSAERFGYPSNMNAWSGADRSYNTGRTAGRTGQSLFGSQDTDTSNPHSYGAAGSAPFGSFGEGAYDRYDPGSSQSLKGFHGKGPKGYKRSDDRIKEDVCETLARDHRIDASDIEVNVENALVTLSGTVDSREIKRAAEMVIENLSGVEDVRNDIKVKKGGEMMAGASRSSSTTSSQKTTPTTKGAGHLS